MRLFVRRLWQELTIEWVVVFLALMLPAAWASARTSLDWGIEQLKVLANPDATLPTNPFWYLIGGMVIGMSWGVALALFFNRLRKSLQREREIANLAILKYR